MRTQYKIILVIISLTALSADIDFDALDNLKKSTVSKSHSIRVNTKEAEKKAYSIPSKTLGLVKSADKFLKSVGEYARNESDMKKLCLARAEYGDTYCYGIQDKDMKNLCLGITKYKSNCFSIHNSDDKNLCLAVSNYKYKSNCFSIHSSDTKNLCLAMTYQYKTSCFGIKDKDKKNLCLGVTQNKSNCFSIR